MRAGNTGLAAVVVSCAAWGPCEAVDPEAAHVPAPAATVVVTTFEDGGPRLVVLDLATGRSAPLPGMAEDGRFCRPSFSSDGSRMVFHGVRGQGGNVPSDCGFAGGRSDIFLASVGPHAVEDVSALTDGGCNTDAAISPDGGAVVYACARTPCDAETQADLCLLRLQDGTTSLLVTSADSERAPAWSQDGRRVAFTRGRGDAADIWIVEIPRPGELPPPPEPITGDGGGDGAEDCSPAFTPAGDLVFVSDRFGNDDVVVLRGSDIDQPDRDDLVMPLAAPDGTVRRDPVAIDAQTVAFASSRGTGFDLCVASLADVAAAPRCYPMPGDQVSPALLPRRASGLRVELSWDEIGDLDLHLVRSVAARWFDRRNDCHFGAGVTSWDAPGAADDPVLDADDIWHVGPESITVAAPVAGRTYRVGVHHFSWSGRRVATVRVFCGDVFAVPTATFERTLSARGGRGRQDFWVVADVNWLGADSCSVSPIGMVLTEDGARRGDLTSRRPVSRRRSGRR
ncbi:MAG: hypothetical protein GYA57_06805 [Myxococcales bacterium]|nr:hypothetical protein [Myxococcales bacterium]